MNKKDRIYIAGHQGLVGDAVMRCLKADGYYNIITRRHFELELTDQAAVNNFFAAEKPEYVFLCAAKVGGIGANSTFPAEFIYQNTMIGFNIVHASYNNGVKKLLNLGSSCIYPKDAPQPMKEEYLLTGVLEPTNEAYAVAKIAVIKLCNAYNKQYGTNYLSVMPSNLYGPGDNYDLENSHVLPAMIRKFHEAKESGMDRVVLWGDGSPHREFLYSQDLAEAVVFLMKNKNAAELGNFINIGTGVDLSVKALAEEVRKVVYAGVEDRKCVIEWDAARANGVKRKLLDVSRLTEIGWKPSTGLADGIKSAYKDFHYGLRKK